MRLRNLMALSCIALPLAAAMPASAATIYVTTNDTGQNSPVDVSRVRAWSFVAQPDWTFGGGFFNMKVGGSADANSFLRLSLRFGTATGTELAYYQYDTIAAFNAAPTTGSNAGYRDGIPFPMTYTLANAQTYWVVMSSNVGTGGDDQYFIKGGSNELTITNVNPPTIVVPPTTNTPEPASALALATGLLALGAVRSRKRAEAVAANA